MVISKRTSKEKTMRKLIIIIIFWIFIYNICGGPTLSASHNADAIVKIRKDLDYKKNYMLFIDHLGHRESNNDWTSINSANCFGEWQFAYGTLKVLGYGDITPEKFKKNPNIFPRDLQLKVLEELIEINNLSLKPYNDYIGRTINHTHITKSGLLAGMHLGGIVAVRLYLTSNGTIDRADLNGTKISDYIREFNMYNL